MRLDRLRAALPHPLRRERLRVFGIGLSKTGTVSLASALERLGVHTLHYPRDLRTYQELLAREPRLSVLREYDGVTDLPATMLYRELARAHPRARFVLTVRDEASWLRSLRQHWARFPSHSVGQETDHLHALRRLTRSAVYGLDEFDAEKLAARRIEHRREVEQFFASEPERLLVLDICAGEGWEKLCPFLGRRAPRQRFPWEHRTDAAAAAPRPA